MAKGESGNAAFAQHSCSREDSREASEIITRSIYPFLGEVDLEAARPAAVAGATTPVACPLNASLDMFLDQQFRTEFYMDRHMDNKHADKLKSAGGQAPVCLGNLCHVLGCGAHRYDACEVGGGGSGGDGRVRGNDGCMACNPNEMDRRRHDCKTLFYRCFKPSGDGGHGHGDEKTERLRDHFVHQFCSHLGCDKRNHPLPPPLLDEKTSDGGGGVGGGYRNQRPPPGTANWNRGGVGTYHRGGFGSRAGTSNHNPLLVSGVDGVGGGGFTRTAKLTMIVFLILGLVLFYSVLGVRFLSNPTNNDLRPGRGRGKRARGRGREPRKGFARWLAAVGVGGEGLRSSTGSSSSGADSGTAVVSASATSEGRRGRGGHVRRRMARDPAGLVDGVDL